MQTRADAALRMLWSMMGWEDADGTVAATATWAQPAGAPEGPHQPWTRRAASSSSGSTARSRTSSTAAADTFVDLMGRPRPYAAPEAEPAPDAPVEPSVRVASIDVGGGTTDLMVTTYYLRDKRALNPVQNFREGFRIAGDDVLSGVTEQMILPAIEAALSEAGARDAQAPWCGFSVATPTI